MATEIVLKNGIVAFEAGTARPVCARKTHIDNDLSRVDFPDILGPVNSTTCLREVKSFVTGFLSRG